MQSLSENMAMQNAAVIDAYEEAIADGNHGRAERIRAANPDLFSALNSSESNDMLEVFKAANKPITGWRR